MKNQIQHSLKQVLTDRGISVALVVFLLLCAAYCIYVGLNIHPIDLTVGVHYSAFGETFYYRERWYYLLSFVGFGIVLGLAHSALAIKLLLQERRQLALLFIYLSMFFVLIAWILTHSVLLVAYPS